jgi:methylmalonyl-CoA/ethylmalonyl-CoA epimerase
MVSGKEEIEHLKVRVAFSEVGATRFELISPSSGDHELVQHLKEQGEGFHHIAFEVRDIKQSLEELNKMGIRLAQDRPRSKGHGGKEIAFLNPEDTCGILIEVCQEKKIEQGLIGE